MLCTKIRNHSFCNRKLHTFWCSAALFGTSKRIKTEVRSRCDWPAGPYWDPKSPLWAFLGVQKIGQITEPESNTQVLPKVSASFLWSHIPSTSFTVHVMPKIRNHLFYNRNPHAFSCSPTLFWHLKPDVRTTSDCEAGPVWCPKSHLRAFLVLARSSQG